MVVGAGEDGNGGDHGGHLDEIGSTNQGVVSVCSQHMNGMCSSQQRQRYVTSLSASVSTAEGSWNRGSSQGSIYDCLGFAVAWYCEIYALGYSLSEGVRTILSI